MDTRYYWYVPVEGDGRQPGSPRPERPGTDFEHLKRVLLTAERVGFDGALIPFSFRNLNYGGEAAYVDTWTTAAALGAVTSRIRLLPAVLTGVAHPWMVARAVATLDHFTGGRVEINVISGARTEPGIGDPLEHDDRYARTDEFIDCLRGLWTEPAFSYAGRFFRFESMGCLPKPLQPEIPLFFSGQSPAARQVALSQPIRTQLLVGDPPDAIARQVQIFRDEALASGRAVDFGFGIRLQVICRESDEAAWAAAQAMMDGFDPAIIRDRAAYLAGRDDSRSARLTALDAHSHVLGPNLWVGLRLVRPGASHALVGSPASIKARLEEYQSAGVSLFILSGYPNDEAAERFGRDVLPLLRPTGAAAGRA